MLGHWFPIKTYLVITIIKILVERSSNKNVIDSLHVTVILEMQFPVIL